MTQESDALLGEMRAVKLLMMLQLLRQGTTRAQIATILGISERTLGRMLPRGTGKPGSAAAVDEPE
jgi:DNA-binding transcriptional regulator LsrR (DeoR family)